MDPLPAGLRTRIAPTPSGLLHSGNGASFLLTARLARLAGGTLLLRIDDLDAERVREPYLADIFDTLHWLGITWQEGPATVEEHRARYSQELRLPRYRSLLDVLREQGSLYACTCSRSTIATCACRDAGHAFEGPDRSWRLRLPPQCPIEVPSWPGPPIVLDLVAALPDPVVRQRNGRPAYQIASLADDVDRGITFIVRGMDLLPSTACQLHLAKLLGLPVFQAVTFVHHPLLVDAKGEKLSKSHGATSLRAQREQGGSAAVVKAQADDLLARLLGGGILAGRDRSLCPVTFWIKSSFSHIWRYHRTSTDHAPPSRPFRFLVPPSRASPREHSTGPFP
ncbi:MAG: glutamate--tRNA ligase family protein [Flavobacteriales bacterium]